MLPVKFRRIDIECDATSCGVDLQGLVAVRVDHRLGALIHRRREQFVKELARKNHRMAALGAIARHDDELFC